jgi:hypothetical protein
MICTVSRRRFAVRGAPTCDFFLGAKCAFVGLVAEFHRHIGTFVTKCFDGKGPLPPADHASCLKDKAVLMAMHRALHK